MSPIHLSYIFSLRSYGCPTSPKVIRRGRRLWSAFSIWSSTLTLLCSCPHGFCCITVFTFLSAKHIEAQPSAVRRSLRSGTCVCISVCHLLPSFSVYFSRCHIISLSLTVRVSTCMLRSAPSVCQGKGGICWVEWIKASRNWFHLHVFWPQRKEKNILTCMFSFTTAYMAPEEKGHFYHFRSGGFLTQPKDVHLG